MTTRIEGLEAHIVLADLPDTLFVCFAREDQEWLDRFQTMLGPMIEGGRLQVWSVNSSPPGSIRADEVEKTIEDCKACLLLVSAKFLASRRILHGELPKLLKRAQNGGLQVFWICVAPCIYEESPVAQFKPLGDPNVPLSCIANPGERDATIKAGCLEILHSFPKMDSSRQPSMLSSEESSVVASLELRLSGPIEEFDPIKFQKVLEELVGTKVRDVRIASIRRGSVIVKLEGKANVIREIENKLSGNEGKAAAESIGLQRIGEMETRLIMPGDSFDEEYRVRLLEETNEGARTYLFANGTRVTVGGSINGISDRGALLDVDKKTKRKAQKPS